MSEENEEEKDLERVTDLPARMSMKTLVKVVS